ncbi:MAG: DUF971 domain-containing protein [Alphaproteobacteria bacterium]|nr:DUF971 domain-containing protein [Alphaproteobacteria bacterium]
MQEISSSSDSLVKLDQGASSLDLTWQDKTCSTFHHIWLRDNCRCKTCGDPATGRRSLRLTDLALDIKPVAASLSEQGDLCLTWPDGHTSTFSIAWLRRHAYDTLSRKSSAFTPVLWTEGTRSAPPRLVFDKVMTDAETFLTMLHHVRDHGLCFLHGAPSQAGSLEPLAEKIGPVQESNFGRVQNLVVDETKQSVANRTVALKPHTDEPYRASPPGILLFHCVETDVTGAGSPLFMDGFALAEQLRAEDPEAFEVLTRHNCTFRRHFAGDVDLIAEAPAISVDEFGNLSGIRINDRVAAPLAIAPEDVEVHYRGMQRLLTLAEDESLAIKLTLRPGDVAVFDNHRILHGRTELSMKGRRFLQWLQVERGDFHSTMRIMADRLETQRGIAPLLRGAY